MPKNVSRLGPMNKIALLIGAGSVGKKHLTILSEQFQKIFVVDPDQNIKIYIEKLRASSIITYLPNLESNNFSEVPYLAIIANWGPDHFKYIKQLSDLGVKNFIIEKPVADSFFELDQIKKIKVENNLNIKTNLSLLYSNLPKLLNKLQMEHLLGEPLGLYVNGGAKCISTIGIHWLGLTNSIFHSRPKYVNATLKSENINPRNKNLVYLEGTAVWSYERDRYLVVSFINSSHIEMKCSILYENARIDIEGEILTLKKISKSDLLKLDKQTKTAIPAELVFRENAFSGSNIRNAFDVIYEEVMNPSINQTLDQGLEVTSDLLAALFASETGARKDLPLNFQDFQDIYIKKWNIS